ncbi:YhcH/YjgK/YiaL family protein [Desulfurivibrio sp. D14AmB]|uniref:YhcH/YjgK/YiaL family protein n=1 Tax=Desulfurivibrio sp. D14AmB TaxID=3374370 RepID=UPI00376F447E
MTAGSYGRRQPSVRAWVRSPGSGHRDRTFYYRPGIASARVSNFPGFFTVLYPDDAHMPKLMTAGKPELVRKVVVKLRRKLVSCAMNSGGLVPAKP